ncbi:hypothetical protein D9613_010435 [Agrocybe pediades]|uniref:Uncharacterized protein n=1 Tax=Agrocybe pediades TaxID=84607 RepID=A0A8H4VJ83_9AGAR|nr:hypothetical protein D9613_010435 [Agrocybe pediades]
MCAMPCDMQSVYKQCLPILQLANSSARGLRRTLLKVELWRSRKEVESNVRNLREQANKCYRRFTRHTQLGTAVAIAELKGAVSEGFSSPIRKLSTLQVWDENVLAFMGSTRAVLSSLPPSVMLSEDLVFKLYVHGHVRKVDEILKNLVSKLSHAVEEPNDCHSPPFTMRYFFSLTTPGAVESVQRNTVTELIRLQQGLLNAEAGGSPTQEGAQALHNLSLDLARLEMYSESLILCTWTVDLYRTLSKSQRDVYAPHLALTMFNLASMSSQTGEFSQAIAMTTECLSILTNCAPAPGIEALKADALSRSAHFRHVIGGHPSALLQDVEDSVSMWERLHGEQMAIVGSVPTKIHAAFNASSVGEDDVVRGYAWALDVQRRFLYASERYPEAFDAGKKALHLFRALAPCYEHARIHSQAALFLCDDVFRDAIPLSSALRYAQEAAQIWEEADGPTDVEEEGILDPLTMETKILVDMGRPSEALTVFQKLARRVRCMNTNQRMYIHTLQDLVSKLFDGMHYAEAAMASRTIAEICRQSADSFLPNSSRLLFVSLLLHANHCEHAGYISEALIHSREALSTARQTKHTKYFKDVEFTEDYLVCAGWTTYLSLEAGYPQEALNHCQDALYIASPFSEYANKILSLITAKALAFLRLGRLSLAAATITEACSFVESTTHNLQEDTYYGKLLSTSALVHRCRGKQDDALTAIQAAIPDFQSLDQAPRLYILSDVQADMGNDAEAFVTAEEAVKLTERRASVSSILNHRHKTSQYSLCLRLFFNGEFTRALQLILAVRAFYEWHAHSRHSWFINLARALRAEGILECVSDKHVEGAAVRTRLDELQQHLRATLPGIADQVYVDLNYERNYPAWTRLLEKYPLTCSHWEEGGANMEKESDS